MNTIYNKSDIKNCIKTLYRKNKKVSRFENFTFYLKRIRGIYDNVEEF